MRVGVCEGEAVKIGVMVSVGEAVRVPVTVMVGVAVLVKRSFGSGASSKAIPPTQ